MDSTSVGGQRAESRERPGPDRGVGARRARASTPDDGALESVREAVAGRLRQGSWREALATCRERAPMLVTEVVDQAGNRAFNEGDFGGLWRELSTLPDAIQCDPAVAYWLYVTATAVNRQADVMGLVSTVLGGSAAPELRAAVAVTKPGADAGTETLKALEAHESATTMRARAFALALEGDRHSPILLFRRAMALAEHSDASHLVVACAIDVANQELALGHYKSGRDWARWALDEYERRDLKEAYRREVAAATLAFAYVLLGDLQGARTALNEVSIQPSKLGIPSYEAVVSTVGDLHLLEGRCDEALALFTLLRRSSPLTQVASASLDVTKCHLAMGDLDAALESAEYAFSLSRGAPRAQAAIGTLGMGMALSYVDLPRATTLLETAARQFEQTNFQLFQTQAAMWLALCHLRQGRVDQAVRSLSLGSDGLRELTDSGWRLLMACDPQHAQLMALWRGGGSPLKVRLLGQPAVEYRSQALPLTSRQCEVLTVLCDREAGVTVEELRELVFGSDVHLGTVKSTVSRLRHLVPISASPYRLLVPFECDFKQVLGFIATGQAHRAVQQYTGPLLPGSLAPGVVELRMHVEECLRRAVIAASDPDLLIQFATAQGDDLELWESARAALAHGDYRLPLVIARIRRIREAWLR